MGEAFSDTANFSKMYSLHVNISRVIHKTYIKVNEEGTEAAAVTAAGMVGTSAILNPVFKLNRPFVYLIMEKQSGSILFLGALNDPTKN
jgi:serpin B